MVHVRYVYKSRRQETVLEDGFRETMPELKEKVTLEDGTVWQVDSMVNYPETVECTVVPYYLLRKKNMEKVYENELH